jgi:hypothetical protein
MARVKCGLLAVPRTVPVQLTRYRTLRIRVIALCACSRLRPKCAVSEVKSVPQYSWISYAMYSAWNFKNNYNISASVYVLQFNGFMSVMLTPNDL